MSADAISPAIAWRRDIDTGAVRGDAGENVIYAVGDIHGCHELAIALLAAIASDIAALPAGSKPVIIFCGDAIDRGGRSADVLSMLVWMRRHAPCEVECLKGNHEAMMLAFLVEPREACAWLEHGGEETVRSYGIAIDDARTRGEQCDRLRDELLDRMPASHLDLLHRMSTRIILGDYLFVHAGLRPRVPLRRQTEEDCLWIRQGFVDRHHKFEKLVVHGHSWQSEDPTITSARIGIDTGAYKTGVLTAIRLRGTTVEFVQAISRGQSPAHLPTGSGELVPDSS